LAWFGGPSKIYFCKRYGGQKEGRRRAEGGQKEGGRRAGGHESFSKKQPQFLPGFDCNEDFVTPIT
jgi:hypothetical protein